MARPALLDIRNIKGPNIVKNPNDPNYKRHVLGPKNVKCPECKALMFIDEKVSGSIRSPKFSMCCARGKVRLPPLPKLPDWYLSLIQQKNLLGKDFIKNIRSYNSAFAFTSFKANVIMTLQKKNLYIK